jgi:hypothetical protein
MVRMYALRIFIYVLTLVDDVMGAIATRVIIESTSSLARQLHDDVPERLLVGRKLNL